MRVHHLNCISSCPLGGHLMDGGSESLLQRAHLTNHCLLIETGRELVLVDTGYGLREVANPHSRLSQFFLRLNHPELREEMTAFRQIQNLGFDPRDVRHVLLTHLDFDHAGGLDDFPWARVHLMESERSSAFERKTWLDKQRYRPQQWGTKDNWVTYEPGEGDSWFGFSRVQELRGVGSEVVMIPLLGHTLGHAGIAVRSGGRWLFDVGDAYFYHAEMNVDHPTCTPGLTTYQLMMDKDHNARVWNQGRLRELKRSRSGEVEIFCSHDVVEFERLAGHPAGISAQNYNGLRPFAGTESTVDPSP